MLNAKAFAGAVTAVTAIVYVACLILSIVMPGVLVGVAQSWVHSIDLAGLQATGAISIQSAAVGLVTISLLAWTTTYATIRLYNTWAGVSVR